MVIAASFVKVLRRPLESADEVAGDGNVSQVRHPELVGSIDDDILGEIWEDRPGMIAVGGDDVAAPALGLQGVLAHQAAELLAVHHHALMAQWHPGELYSRVGFIVTNMTRPAERVTLFYNHRGTAEQRIKEGKNAVAWTRLSCHRFASNAVRLQLHALA